jgi:hypothetical protein
MIFEKIQHGKLITSYGCIGSLVQSRDNGSLMISRFTQWPYYRYLNNRYPIVQNPDEYRQNEEFVDDPRLQQRLIQEFPVPLQNLKCLFRIPENDIDYLNGDIVSSNHMIGAVLVPKWFVCPLCKTNNLRYFDNLVNPNNKQFPICRGTQQNPHSFERMEQFPFILVSSNGDLADIPWDAYINHIINNPNAPALNFIPRSVNPNNRSYTYHSGGSAEHLETKYLIVGDDAGNERPIPFTKLANLSFLYNDIEFKLVARQSNNICFGKYASSIYIPQFELPYDMVGSLNAAKNLVLDRRLNLNEVSLHEQYNLLFPDRPIEREKISQWLNDALVNQIEDLDDRLKLKEYRYLISEDSIDHQNLMTKRYRIDDFLMKNIYRIEKLKVTHAQLSFKRLNTDSPDVPIFDTSDGGRIRFYPVIELFGEGILMEYDVERLNETITDHQKSFDFIHTLNHCIIKELEFDCGYQAVSLKERIYFLIDEEKEKVLYAGAMIYVAVGGSGSFGGLTSLFQSDLAPNDMDIVKIVRNAIKRSKDCPNDPICIEEEKHGNVGACYACTLIHEVACENFNRKLDRKIMNEVFEGFE